MGRWAARVSPVHHIVMFQSFNMVGAQAFSHYEDRCLLLEVILEFTAMAYGALDDLMVARLKKGLSSKDLLQLWCFDR